MLAKRDISISLGSFVRHTPLEAAKKADAGIEVPVLGTIGLGVIQLCPQNRAHIDEATIDELRDHFPDKEIRFHANVQMEETKCIVDVIDFDPGRLYWKRMKDMIRYAGCKAYSAHAGLRKNGTMNQLIDKHKSMMDFLDIPVAIEGHYPAKRNPYLASTWMEWIMMYESGLPFVVDLSHAQIIAHYYKDEALDLMQAMVSSERCLEVHVSGNDSVSDQHRPMRGDEWWLPLLQNLHAGTEIFYEGIFR